MKCPYCSYFESKVVDSRPTDEGGSIRRRRECLSCQKRFTTYETIEKMPLFVVKKDCSRQVFDRNKLLNGLFRACEKRRVPLPVLEGVVTEVEQQIQSSNDREMSTQEIGEIIMMRLKEIDQVAYIRFVSVYRSFEDTASFLAELTSLADKD